MSAFKISKAREVKPNSIRGLTASNWRVFNEENGLDFKEDKFSFVVFSGQCQIGAARCKIVGGIMELTSIIVNKNFRGQGAGKELLKAVESLALEKECRKVILKTSEKHTQAINFYESYGYKRVATLPNWTFGIDWYFYEKEL